MEIIKLNMKQLERIKLKGIWELYFTKAGTSILLRHSRYENTICNVGLYALAAQTARQFLAKTEFKITYGAVGTSATAPAAADTQLGTEIARVALTSGSSASAIGTVSFFFNSATGNGTLKEMGAFADGWNGTANITASGTANTGILFSHVAITETKTTAEDLTCVYNITFA